MATPTAPWMEWQSKYISITVHVGRNCYNNDDYKGVKLPAIFEVPRASLIQYPYFDTLVQRHDHDDEDIYLVDLVGLDDVFPEGFAEFVKWTMTGDALEDVEIGRAGIRACLGVCFLGFLIEGPILFNLGLKKLYDFYKADSDVIFNFFTDVDTRYLKLVLNTVGNDHSLFNFILMLIAHHLICKVVGGADQGGIGCILSDLGDDGRDLSSIGRELFTEVAHLYKYNNTRQQTTSGSRFPDILPVERYLLF